MNRYTGVAYTPKKTKDFEKLIKKAFTEKYSVNLEEALKPFRAKIRVFYKPADSLSIKKKKELINQKFYVKKPDTDNIAKSILDGLNELAYKDDSQVVELLVTKYYDEENRIEIELETID